MTNTPTEKCCEQCIERGDFRGEIYHIDPDCPCHSPTEKCPKAGTTHLGCGVCYPKLYPFASQNPTENCSGCTDRFSEGTHQMHTIQHPCPEGGDPNCGYCTPTTDSKNSSEKNYSHISHSHCWAQGKEPACGQSLEKHSQCCLCDTPKPSPTENNDWELSKTPAYPQGGSSLTISYPNRPTENSWKEKVEDAVFAIEGGTSRSTKIRIITELARHIEQEAYERGWKAGYAEGRNDGQKLMDERNELDSQLAALNERTDTEITHQKPTN